MHRRDFTLKKFVFIIDLFLELQPFLVLSKVSIARELFFLDMRSVMKFTIVSVQIKSEISSNTHVAVNLFM